MSDATHSEPHFEGERLPRSLEHYQATDHFMDRLKYRTDPAPSKRIVKEALEHGVVKCTHHPDRFIFEDERGLYTWWVVVRCRLDGPPHELLTIYEPNRHDSNHRTVFDDE